MQNLKKIRLDKKISQKDLAEKMNVTSATISLWESGKREPSLDALRKLSETLGVTIDALVKDA